MKTTYFRLAILMVLMNLTLTTCKKDQDNGPQARCLLTRADRGDGYYETYQYDAKGSLTSVFYHVPIGPYTEEYTDSVTIERDSQHRIVKMVSQRGYDFGFITTMEYNAKGQLSKITTASEAYADSYTSTIAEYDSQGLIVKTTTTYSSYGTPSTFIYSYVYSNGNLTKRTDGQTGKSMTYEYYPNQQARQHELSAFDYAKGLILATPSKNLLKAVNTEGDVMSYSYQYNQQGLVSKTTFQYVFNGTSESRTLFAYTYHCK